ncbi:MAG: hypothetical protein RL385_5365, partial [Pseudomonadota bacterium]
VRPCIALAREVGASAGHIAERVAELLGYQVWGKTLTERVSQKLGVSHAEAAELDERSTGLFDGLRSGVFRAQALSGATYRRALSAVVDEICTRGEAVLLGRGAALLARPEQALRVRIVAPRALRIQRLASRFGLAIGEAERRVLRADRDQLRFSAQLTGGGEPASASYDLVLSTAELDVEAAARVIEACYRARFPMEVVKPVILKQPAQRVEEVLQ